MIYFSTSPLFFTLVVFQHFQSTQSETEVLTGHLKPLGGHRPPETNLVDELFELPDPQTFWRKYVKPSRAAVLRGAIRHSRAFTEWTDQYLKKHFGELEVRLEGKKEKSGRVPLGARGVGRDTIGNFVDNMHDPDAKAYIVSELPTPMWKDITVIPPLTCGTWKDRFVEVDLWMSGGDTHSILHKDAFNAINCLINGTKKWKMIEYQHEDKIYKAWEPPEMIGGYSRINVKEVDLIKYPQVAEVPWSYLTINAGDCLFLPKSYYHQVSSSGDSNIAVALLFSRFDDVEELNFTDCNNKTPRYTPLSEMELDWQYPGYGNLTMGLTHLEDVRAAIKLFFNGEKILDKEALIRKSHEKRPQPKKSVEYYQQEVQQQSRKVFEHMGGNEKGYIALEDVDKLSREQMRRIVWAFEGTDISNREDYEYGYIASRDIDDILMNLLENNGHIERKQFIDRYIKDLGGTRKFATELLERLGGQGSEYVNQHEYDNNLQKALQPYEDNSQDSDDDLPPGRGKPLPQDAYMEDEDEETGNKNEQVLQQKTGTNDDSSSHDEL